MGVGGFVLLLIAFYFVYNIRSSAIKVVPVRGKYVDGDVDEHHKNKDLEITTQLQVTDHEEQQYLDMNNDEGKLFDEVEECQCKV